MRIVQTLFALCVLGSEMAQAARLGELQVLSRQGQPFEAEVAVEGWKPSDERPGVRVVQPIEATVSNRAERIWPYTRVEAGRAGQIVVKVSAVFDLGGAVSNWCFSLNQSRAGAPCVIWYRHPLRMRWPGHRERESSGRP